MVTKKSKGLGRGLEALLGPKVHEPAAGSAADDTPHTLKLTQMVAGEYQPRTRMDEGSLNELASSIAAQGLVQPIIVRPLGVGASTPYEILGGVAAGERVVTEGAWAVHLTKLTPTTTNHNHTH